MPETSKCAFCSTPATQKCSGCHSIYYCSKDHQKRHWKTHKTECRSFQVSNDEVLRRHLTTIRDVKSGEIVLKERPLVYGPSQTTVPVCLGCGKMVRSDDCIGCSKCGWPVCGVECEKADCHQAECYYTEKAGKKVTINIFEVIHPSYQGITILRCLYKKQFEPQIWSKLDALETHYEERKQTPKFENDRNVAKFVLNFFKLEEIFTEEDILKVCGLLMVNGHEIPTTDPPHVAIYETTSMLEHSCRANCCKSFTADGSVLISSSEAIPKGAHLSICYTDPLWGTANRRHHLHETKFFWCNCTRCADTKQFGTNFNSIKCRGSGCKNGLVLPETFLKEGGDWLCDTCKTSMSSYVVEEMLHKIGGELQTMPKGDSKACKDFIAKQEAYLHRNHYYLVDVKVALAQILGQEDENGLAGLSDDDLRLKIDLCKQLTKLIAVIAPAEKRLRGMLLFELHAGIAELGRRNASASSLIESKDVLRQVIDLLKHEPFILPEGKIYKQAVQNMNDIEVLIKTLYQTVGDTPI